MLTCECYDKKKKKNSSEKNALQDSIVYAHKSGAQGKFKFHN
jgi:hypothetical protein